MKDERTEAKVISRRDRQTRSPCEEQARCYNGVTSVKVAKVQDKNGMGYMTGKWAEPRIG